MTVEPVLFVLVVLCALLGGYFDFVAEWDPSEDDKIESGWRKAKRDGDVKAVRKTNWPRSE